MELDILIIANGISSLIVSIVSIITGLKIASKYFRYKERVLLFVGMTWLLMYEAWWGPSISFILLLLTNQTLPIRLFFLISVSFTPVAICLWMIAFFDLVHEKMLKPIAIIFSIQIILFEIYAGYYLTTDYSVIVESVGFIDARYKSFVLLFFIEVLCLFIITVPLFVRESIRSDNLEVKLKGKFILFGFIFALTGWVLDAFLELDLLTLLIYRGLLVVSSITFYFGFFLPKSLKRYLLREN